MATIFKRGKYWWLCYGIGGGKVHRESLKTTDKGVATRALRKWEQDRELRHLGIGRPRNPTLTEFWKLYSEWATANKRLMSHKRATIFWEQFTAHVQAHRLGDITKADVQSFIAWRREVGNSKVTANSALKDLRAIINRGIRQGWYTAGANVFESVDPFPVPRQQVKFFTPEQLAKLLEVVETRPLYLKWVVLLAAYAGLRRNEIANCRWEWLSFGDTPQIHVQRGHGFEVKDAQDRSIPMAKIIADALLPHVQTEGYLFPASLQSAGKNLQYRWDPKKALMTALREACLSDKEPFLTLRHSFGSLHARAGTPLPIISEWMGHSSIQTTRAHYVNATGYDARIDSIT